MALHFKVLILVCLITLFSCNQEKVLDRSLIISFQFNDAAGDVEPSYQTAIWLEKEDHSRVTTLFLSEYLSYGGYNDSTICPAWNSIADWGNAPEEAYDAVTRATPTVGQHDISFNLDSLRLSEGDYRCYFQLHIVENYHILWYQSIQINDPEVILGEVHTNYSPQPYPGAEHILDHVELAIRENEY